MAFQAKVDVFTDVDPTGPDSGRILLSGDPGIKFKLIGKGGVLDDKTAKRFGVQVGGAFQIHDPEADAAAREAANVATYSTNATLGITQHTGYPAPVAVSSVLPDAASPDLPATTDSTK